MIYSEKPVLPISGVATIYNDSQSIIQFLENIESQSVHPEQLIIVDGGSTDNSTNKIEEFSKGCNLKIVLLADNQRKNIAEGLNEGISRSSENWILILGTGNSYDPEFIEKLWARKKESGSKVFYSSVLGMNRTGFSKIFNEYFLNGNKPFDWEPSNHGCLMHREVFFKYGLFWEGFHYAGEDSEFFRRLHFGKEHVEYVADAVLCWETPKSWREYLKKMEVNAIAELQILTVNSLLLRAGKLVMISMVLLVTLLLFPKTIIGLLPLFLVVACKKRTFSPLSLLLGVFTKYLSVYYQAKNISFSSDKCSVTQAKILKK